MEEKTINLDCAVVYFWYDHLLLRENGDIKIVNQAIEEGNYDTFMEMYHKYNDKEEYDNILFFPDEAALFVNGMIVGSIDITIPEGFRLITDSDYECG